MKKIIFVIVTLFSITTFAKDAPKAPEYILTVTDKGFEPATLKVKKDTSFILKVTRKTDSTCATDLVIPSQKIKVELPLNKEVEVKVGKLAKGEVKFGCAMDMMIGAVMIAE